MEKLIERVLDRCGYGYMEPTAQNIIDVFLEYIDHGIYPELDYDGVKQDIESGEITLEMICHNLLRVR
jgi:hypothetical protein